MKTFYTLMWILFQLIAVVLILTGDNYSQITMNLVLSLMFYNYARDE